MTSLPVSKKPLTKVTALALTDQIRKSVSRTWELLLAAYEGQAHLALGYQTWDAYVGAEFNMTRGNAYRLVNQGIVTKALAEATGDVSRARDTIEVSARQAIVLSPHLEEATEEIVQAVKSGAEPKEAVKAAVAKRSEPKRPKPPVEEEDSEARAIEAEEVARRARVITVDAVPVIERADVAYFMKGMDEMDPRAVARVITEREVMAHNRWWGSVIAARQDLQPLTEAARQRAATGRTSVASPQ